MSDQKGDNEAGYAVSWWIVFFIVLSMVFFY